MIKHVAILMGGQSREREVSITSGKSITEALLKLGHKVTVVDPDSNLSETLRLIKPDVVYNSLHGTYGEDGAIPGVLEVLGIPYTHSGILPSAIGMNKYLTKQLLENYGIRFANSLYLDVDEIMQLAKNDKDPMPRPYVIKPTSEGSTLGVYIIGKKDLNFAQQQKTHPWRYGTKAIVEEYIPGQEISTVVLNDNALGSLELRPKTGFYDYEAKYSDGMTDHIYPADIPKEAYEESLHFAQTAHRILGCRTVSRSDMRYNPKTNKLYFLEINTHPGFTDLSIVPDVASKNGINFIQLVEIILNDARLDLKDK